MLGAVPGAEGSWVRGHAAKPRAALRGDRAPPPHAGPHGHHQTRKRPVAMQGRRLFIPWGEDCKHQRRTGSASQDRDLKPRVVCSVRLVQRTCGGERGSRVPPRSPLHTQDPDVTTRTQPHPKGSTASGGTLIAGNWAKLSRSNSRVTPWQLLSHAQGTIQAEVGCRLPPSAPLSPRVGLAA